MKLTERSEASARDMTMSLDTYRDWHKAIITDNLEFTTNLLAGLHPADKEKHLNGCFVYSDSETRRVLERNFGREVEVQCYRPLGLAVVFGSRNVLRVMLEHGADPTRRETNQDTILHMIISVASSYDNTECGLTEMLVYLMSLLTKQQQKWLLFSENALGLRPLEEAARTGCMRILRTIFQTPGVYLTKEISSGMLNYQWYDVTEYELVSGSSRRGKSPLAFITYMTSEASEKSDTKELLSWKPFQHWYNLKMACNMPALVVWSTYRLMLSLIVMAMMTDNSILAKLGGVPQDEVLLYPNASFYYCAGYTIVSFSPTETFLVAIIIAICGLLGMAIDIGELLFVLVSHRPEFEWLQLRRGNLAISFWFSRVVHFLFLLSSAITTIRIAENHPLGVDTISDVGRLVFVISAFSSLFLFLELIPEIGFYILSIKRMLTDLFYFFLLYMVCVSPFVLYFMVFVNTNSKQGCIDHFYSYSQSFYTTFLVMLNLRDLTKYRVQNAVVLYATHMIFVFVVAILLVNFLIATMSESGFRISKKKEVLIRIERLHTLFTVDTWFGWISKKYQYYILRKVARVENGRVYILNVEKIDL